MADYDDSTRHMYNMCYEAITTCSSFRNIFSIKSILHMDSININELKILRKQDTKLKWNEIRRTTIDTKRVS